MNLPSTVQLVHEASTGSCDIAVVWAGNALLTDSSLSKRERVCKDGSRSDQQKGDNRCGLHIADFGTEKMVET